MQIEFCSSCATSFLQARFRVSLALGRRGYGDQFDVGLSETALPEELRAGVAAWS
jgi:hypothetical protein